MATKTDRLAKVIYWASTDNDARGYAGATGEITLPQRHAMKVAREIDLFGESAVLEAIEKFGADKHAYVKWPAASGHGVTIKYESGRTREVRGYDD